MKTPEQIAEAYRAIKLAAFACAKGKSGDPDENLIAIMHVAGVLAWITDDKTCPTYPSTEKVILRMIGHLDRVDTMSNENRI